MKDHRIIFERVKKENRGQIFFRPALVAAIISIFSFVLLFTVTAYSPLEMGFIYSLTAFGMSIVIALALFLLLWLRSREGVNETAISMDKNHHAKSRLEASLELDSTDNPLKDAQITQTTEYYSAVPYVNWGVWLSLFLLIIILLFSANCIFISIQYDITLALQKELNLVQVKKKKKVDKPEKPGEDYYDLTLTSPKAELRAKPLDEIDWSGEVEASNGFNDIALSIYLNGEHKSDISIKNFKKNTPGKLIVEGAFYLDEFNVTPFDIISYHLMGHADIDKEKNKKVLGVPQFIEVRPFREDAYHLQMKGLSAKEKEKQKLTIKLIKIITRLLRFQLSLNKATYTVRASGLSYDGKVLKEQISILSDEQKQLKMEISKLIKDTPAELFTPNMMDCLRKSETAMENATLPLQKLGKKNRGFIQ